MQFKEIIWVHDDTVVVSLIGGSYIEVALLEMLMDEG